MTQKRDFYEVLGVARTASDDDVRKAYRQAALKHHPDRNPGDASAEEKFKEATEAYSVLSDGDKRAQYDRFGHAGVQGGGFDFQGAGMGDIFSHFQDVFADFFGGGGGFGNTQRRRPARGDDVRAEASITFEQAMTGTKQEVEVVGAAPCETCSGSGAAPGTSPERCRQCNGSGQVNTQRGFIMFSTTCPVCRGTGSMIATPCETCRGAGRTEKRRKVVVTFPGGIDTGQRLRVPGQGMPGPDGSPAGDLYVDVEVEEDARFERDGADLIMRRKVSFAEASLGADFKLKLPDGAEVSLKVPAGTQPGTVLSVEGKGFPRLDRRGRGHLHVVVGVHVPKGLSRKARKALEEIAEEITPAKET
ncbi:MAG TPA: molecular chaperone DnaJ [Polyangiaceae bacterium]|nr:molecular chaperone DnaJ [Polyangiaceae bacterium]